MLRAHVLCARPVLGAGTQPRHLTVLDIQVESKTENHHTLKRNDPASPTELTLWSETKNKQLVEESAPWSEGWIMAQREGGAGAGWGSGEERSPEAQGLMGDEPQWVQTGPALVP